MTKEHVKDRLRKVVVLATEMRKELRWVQGKAVRDLLEVINELEVNIATILADYDSGPENSSDEISGISSNKNNGNSGFAGGCTTRAA